MNDTTHSSRRSFIKLSSVMGGGLALGFHLPAVGINKPARLQLTPELNAYVQIRSDNRIIIAAQNPEIGQGVKTSLPMIVAEELDVSWDDVHVVQSAINADSYGKQMAGGSRSIPDRWEALRTAGANARAMLINAAATQWNVPSEECTTDAGVVHHISSAKQATYGSLAERAALQEIPKNVELKNRSDFKLLGKRIGGVDNHAIVTGEPLFGIDQSVEGMQYAVYSKCPATGGTVKSANLKEIKQLPGVSDAFILQGNGKPEELMSGVAIVAKSTWAAFSALKKLRVEWDERNAAKDSWTELQQKARESAKKTGAQLVLEGAPDQALKASKTTLESYYSYPFVSHAQMEPQNCTASYADGRCELWAPTQLPQAAIASVAKLLDIDQDKVVLNQTRAGGGFGRRLMNDFCCEAAAISKQIGAPVKLQWRREDDMAHDFYRAGGFHMLQAGLDEQGQITAWKNHFVTVSSDGEKPARGSQIQTTEFPHSKVANTSVQQTLLDCQINTGYWRAPISCAVAFAMQGFIHELAVASGRDHTEFLLELMEAKDVNPDLKSFDAQRATSVVRAVHKRANAGGPLADGHHHGLAFYYSHSGYCAHIAEVSVGENKKLRLHKVTVVSDVGPIVNLSGAENQVEGSVVDGFSTAMGLQLSFENGRIQESNYHQYPLLRMMHAPEIDVHFIESDNPPTGLGEPALPPVAPAIANAVFNATGERLREMPFTNAGFKL